MGLAIRYRLMLDSFWDDYKFALHLYQFDVRVVDRSHDSRAPELAKQSELLSDVHFLDFGTIERQFEVTRRLKARLST